jgi:hypothetical protein
MSSIKKRNVTQYIITCPKVDSNYREICEGVSYAEK